MRVYKNCIVYLGVISHANDVSIVRPRCTGAQQYYTVTVFTNERKSSVMCTPYGRGALET